MMKLSCNDVIVWLRRDLDGSAEPSAEVAAHIERCEECAHEAGRLKRMAAEAREALPPARVPFDFTDRVMDALVEPTGDAALAEAVRPRRNGALVLVAMLIAAGLFVVWPRDKGAPQDRPAEGAEGGDAYSKLAEGDKDGTGRIVPPAPPRVDVTLVLSKHGEIVHDGFPVSLDGLTMLFRRKNAKSVLVRGDPLAPWRHVQWLMMICAESGISKVHVALGRGIAHDASLPRDPGIVARPARRIRVRMKLQPRDEVEEERGPEKYKRKVRVPSKVEYRFGDRTTLKRATAAGWISEAKNAAAGVPAHLYGEIVAGNKAPLRDVVSTLGAFRKAGIEDVRFYGTTPPTAIDRRRPFLAYPSADWGRGQVPVKQMPVKPVKWPVAQRERQLVVELLAKRLLERTVALNNQIAQGGNAQRIAELRAELDVVRKQLRDAKANVKRLRRNVAGQVEIVEEEPEEIPARAGAAGKPVDPRAQAEAEAKKLAEDKARIQQRMARLNAELAARAAEMEARAAARAKRAQGLAGRAGGPAPARDPVHIAKLKRDLAKMQLALTKDPQNAQLRADVHEARMALARATAQGRFLTARKAHLAKMIKLYQAELDRLAAQRKAAGGRLDPRQQARHDELVRALKIAFREFQAGGATQTRTVAPPKTTAEALKILHTRAGAQHAILQKAAARGDRTMSEAAKKELDRLADLVDEAKTVQKLETHRDAEKKAGKDTTDLDKKVDLARAQLFKKVGLLGGPATKRVLPPDRVETKPSRRR